VLKRAEDVDVIGMFVEQALGLERGGQRRLKPVGQFLDLFTASLAPMPARMIGRFALAIMPTASSRSSPSGT
jgi:hypothetical protein